MARKGFLREDGSGDFLVGAEEIGDGHDYRGPVARVSADDKWLHITTDDYEGAAMLNIEALPYLRRALSRIAKERRSSKKAGASFPGRPDGER